MKAGRTLRLLDLFCGAGGCSVGYERAGFEVTGVDSEPQPNYPSRFRFYREDALDFLWRQGHEFDAVHASPPCQKYVSLARATERREHTGLIEEVRSELRRLGTPYVIENVQGAPLDPWIRLCGSSFRLGVRRHRLFESSHVIFALPCQHKNHDVRGVYGQHSDYGKEWPRLRGTGGVHRRAVSVEDARTRMGIDWMDWRELTQAIPPAYTEFIGGQLGAIVLAQKQPVEAV